MDNKEYFMNESLLSILTVNNVKGWHFKSQVFDDFVKRIGPFFAGDKGEKSKLSSKVTFITNMNINFVIIYIRIIMYM